MYRIGELAKLYQLKTDTLRFYEKSGLLSASSRTPAGYRVYTQGDAQKLKFILQAKTVGFTLSEIEELLSIDIDKANKACSDVKGLMDSKITQVTNKIAELEQFRTNLQRLSDACCGGENSAKDCSILEALESNVHCVKPEKHQFHNNNTPKFRK